jgi:hypothetical protein
MFSTRMKPSLMGSQDAGGGMLRRRQTLAAYLTAWRTMAHTPQAKDMSRLVVVAADTTQ